VPIFALFWAIKLDQINLTLVLSGATKQPRS
jgi:hypothetical protein